MKLLAIFKNKLKELKAMFSNYELRKKTRYSHLEEHKKTSKKAKQKTRFLNKPELKPTLLNIN